MGKRFEVNPATSGQSTATKRYAKRFLIGTLGPYLVKAADKSRRGSRSERVRGAARPL